MKVTVPTVIENATVIGVDGETTSITITSDRATTVNIGGTPTFLTKGSTLNLSFHGRIVIFGVSDA